MSGEYSDNPTAEEREAYQRDDHDADLIQEDWEVKRERAKARYRARLRSLPMGATTDPGEFEDEEEDE
jgi:hypothetical protein